jgi:hypothetical protein
MAQSQRTCIPPNWLGYGLQVRTISDTQCIPMFNESWHGDTVELEGRQPIINTPLHLASHSNRILEKELWWIEEGRRRVKVHEETSVHDGPHKLRGPMIARHGCVSPRAGKECLCISYNVMMSIYPGVTQIYTLCRLVHLCYLCISVCIY